VAILEASKRILNTVGQSFCSCKSEKFLKPLWHCILLLYQVAMEQDMLCWMASNIH